MLHYPLHWLSGKRISNMLCLLSSYATSVLLKRPVGSAYPYAASIEPANYCNLSCPQCPTGKKLIDKKAQKLGYEDFCGMVDALSPCLMYLNLYFQGEPFLNNDLPRMIRYAHDKKILTCVSTNAHFLDDAMVQQLKESGIDRLIISLDGYDQASYERYRVGGNFQQVIAAIQRCVAADLPVEVQCLLLASTENAKAQMQQLVQQLGVKRFYFKQAQFYDDYLMPQQAENLRYRRNQQGQWEVKKPRKNRCFRMLSSVVLDVHGNVLPCCYDKDGKHRYGNLWQQPFAAIWQGEKAKAFRSRVWKNRSSIAICCNCTE